MVMVGSYLYALDYDNARIVEINPGTYVPTGVSYTLAAGFVPSGYVAHGQAIIEIGGALYGLFTFANSAWTAYASSLLVRFTMVGGTSITVAATDANNGIEKNAFALAVNGAASTSPRSAARRSRVRRTRTRSCRASPTAPRTSARRRSPRS